MRRAVVRFAPPLQAALGKVEFGDALFFAYITVFVRQWFWAMEGAAAWALTLAVTTLVWGVHLRAKPEAEERTPRLFWAAVALPLLLVYALRVAFPDLSFDVLNHRLIQSERALRGVQLLPGDFFPTIFPFNPTSDMLTGIFRHLLGYRLGTIVNYLALVWAGTVLEKILRPYVKRASWRTLCVLAVLAAEHVLFEINNYMVDLLALPLLLEAMRLALNYDESEHKRRDLLFSALMLGVAVALKLTNAAMVAPVLLIFAVRVFSSRVDAKTIALILLAGLFFLIPLAPHAAYIYAETGSPFFPLYNKFFQSPLWPYINPYDGRWGPHDARETLLWPLVIASHPERLSELNVYSGRMTLGVLAAALCLLLPRVATRARLIALATLAGAMLWSATSGYIRYALFLELTGGVLLIYLARYLWERAALWPRAMRLVAAALPLCLLAAQCVLAVVYVRQTEWSKRPVVFDEWSAYRRELRWVGRDRELMRFQTAENRALFEQADAWIVSGLKTNGIEVLLRPDVPMIAVNNSEYFARSDARRRFAAALEPLRDRHVYSLSLMEDLDASLKFLKERRLVVRSTTSLLLPFFSARTQFHVALIEVGLPEKRTPPVKTAGQPETTEIAGPLEDDAFLARLSATDAPATMRPGQKATLRVTVKNLSEYVWPARGRKDGTLALRVADIWYAADGETLVNNLDGRSLLPRDLWPGEETEVKLEITAPARTGDYVLELDLVQEGVTWFKDRDSETWRARIKVE